MTDKDALYIRALREEKLAARGGLEKSLRAEFSRLICESIARSETFRRAKTVMLYRAVKSEVSLEALAAVPGKSFVFPSCVGKRKMRVLLPLDKEAWSIGAYGIPEPDAARSAIVPPEKIDLVICPCAAFDAECRRVGMGAGYYDRFLPLCVNAAVIAAAFEAQRGERIPAAPWDVPMDAVYTESAVYRRR